MMEGNEPLESEIIDPLSGLGPSLQTLAYIATLEGAFWADGKACTLE